MNNFYRLAAVVGLIGLLFWPTPEPAQAICLAGIDWNAVIFGSPPDEDLSTICDRQVDINQEKLNEFFEQIQDAADKMNALPDEINKAGPSGTTLTSATAGAGQIAGYVKWLFSPASAQELLGRSLAPIGINVMAIFLMTVAMVAIYITINIVVFTIKMVVWSMNQILKILPFW